MEGGDSMTEEKQEEDHEEEEFHELKKRFRI